MNYFLNVVLSSAMIIFCRQENLLVANYKSWWWI